MVKPGSPINERQWQVLLRIADGEPVTRSNSSLITTVNALRDRGQVTLEKHRMGGGRAALSSAGRQVLGGVHTTTVGGVFSAASQLNPYRSVGPVCWRLARQECTRLPC
jgi:hypothetical protein